MGYKILSYILLNYLNNKKSPQRIHSLRQYYPENYYQTEENVLHGLETLIYVSLDEFISMLLLRVELC